jgi:Acetyltransferase (GNAT) domain
MSLLRSPQYFKIHTGLPNLSAFAERWSALHTSSDLWARFELFHAYVTSLVDADTTVYVIEIFQGNSTVAVVPAIVSEQHVAPFGKVSVLSLANSDHISVTDFPLDTNADRVFVARRLFEAFQTLPTKWSVLRWPRIMHSSNALAVAREFPQGVCTIRPSSPCNTFDTRQSFQQLVQGFSKNIRASLKKSRKRLQEIPSWSVEVAKGPEQAKTAFEEFLRLEASGWKGQSGTGSAIRLRPELEHFYSLLLDQEGPDFVPEVALLNVNKAAVAAQFSVCARASKHIVKIAYDESQSRFSPGQILLEEVLSMACSSPSIERVSLVTDMSWHQTWRPQAEETSDVVLFRTKVMGTLFRLFLIGREEFRTAVKSLKRVRAAK